MDNLAQVKALLKKISATDTDSSFREEAKDLLNKLDDDVMIRRIEELEAEIKEKDKELLVAKFMVMGAENSDQAKPSICVTM